MFIVWILIGILIGMILSCKLPSICGVIGKAWNWIKGKLGRSTPTIIAMFSVMLLATTLQACAKQKADAYICGEPPNEVTFYCKPGTGPPRSDCGLPQSGEFDKDPITC
jgi:hypothetical protein